MYLVSHPLPQLCQPGHAGKCVYLVSYPLPQLCQPGHTGKCVYLVGHPLPQLCQPGHAGKCVYLVGHPLPQLCQPGHAGKCVYLVGHPLPQLCQPGHAGKCVYLVGHPLPQLCQPGHAGKCVYPVNLAMQVSVCTWSAILYPSCVNLVMQIVIMIIMMIRSFSKAQIEIFFYNLLTAPRTVSNTYAQVAQAQSFANHERLSRATRRDTRHVVRKDSSAIKFDSVEIAFILASSDWLNH